MNAPIFSNLVPGAHFHGRYCVVRAIRAGNMGAVYEVLDEKTDTPRALKVMLPSMIEDGDLRSRFEREAKITGHIASDHIVKVTDAEIDAATGIPFLVMELLQGHEVGALLKQRGPFPAEEVVTYLFQAALALDKTHAAGIVHRDLKPENMFVTERDDGSPCIKLLDFGIAKIVAQGNALAGTRAMGTPLYMAPEQVHQGRAIGPQTDIYALGHIAYALLVGEPYWKEETKNAESVFSAIGVIVAGPKEPPGKRAERRSGVELPAAFDEWFFKATAQRSEDRFERASEAVRALGDALGVPLPRAQLPTFSTEPRAVTNASAAAAAPKGREENPPTPDKPEPTAVLAAPGGTVLLDPPQAPVPSAMSGSGDAAPSAQMAARPVSEATASSLSASMPDIAAKPSPRLRWPMVAVPALLLVVVAVVVFSSNRDPTAPESRGAPTALPVEAARTTVTATATSEVVPEKPVDAIDAGVDASGVSAAAAQSSAPPSTPASTSTSSTSPAETAKPPPPKTVPPRPGVPKREDLF